MNTEEQKQLIGKMQMLKEIKPNREWAVLLKHKILASSSAPVEIENWKIGKFIENWKLGFGISKRLAYSFATLLLVMAGLAGFAGQTMPGEQTASLSMQATAVKQKVTAINSKIRDLTKVLKSNSVQDPQAIKDIIAGLKTLAYVPGTDSTSTLNADLQDLYGALAVNQITDLQKTTLTNAQQKIVSEAIELYKDEKYSEALEKVLMINSREEIN